MRKSVLLGLGRYMIPIPRVIWQGGLSGKASKVAARVAAMPEERHLVRDFVVREIPRVGKPLSPEFIGRNLNMPVARVTAILDDLEKGRVFLFRNEQGAVVWAYPATAETTPHHITFSSGEEGYAA